jgi:hypothetical protein
MALAVTTRVALGDTTATTVYTTASFTPTANSLLIVALETSRGSSLTPDLAVITNSGISLTWVQMADHIWGVGNRLTIFGAIIGSAPAAMTVTATFANALTACGHSVFDVTGSDAAAHGIAQTLVQSVVTTAGSTGLSLALTLAAAGNANNRPFLAVVHSVNEVYTLETGNNWAQIGALAGHSGPPAGFITAWKSDGFDTSVTASWATSTGYGAIAFELKALVGGVFSVSVDTASYAYGTGTASARFDRKVTVTPTASFAYTTQNIVGRFNRKVVAALANFAYATGNIIGKYSRKFIVTPAASYAYTTGNIIGRFGRKLVVTAPSSPALTFNSVALRKNAQLSVGVTNFLYTVPTNIGLRLNRKVSVVTLAPPPLTFNPVNLRKGAFVTVTVSNYAYGVGSVTLRKHYKRSIQVTSYAYTVRDVTLRKGFYVSTGVINFAYATSNVLMAKVFGPAVFDKIHFPFDLNSVNLLYEPIEPEPEPEPEPIPLPGPVLQPSPGVLKPGDQVYVSVQGDMWDLISQKVYGMQRGSDHYLDRLIEANPQFNSYNQLPGGFYILVPPLPTQTEIPLVPWKRATILIKT